VIYWIATGLVSAGMLMSAFMYLTKSPQLIKSFQELGYPLYFATLVGIAKLLGAVALLIPTWSKVKEWAYAGFAFTFIGAVWAHLATGTPWVAPLIALLILLVSYWFRVKAKLA
jgi:uncharacterized membrane protein YphA (DoxX/SURF4 family)